MKGTEEKGVFSSETAESTAESKRKFPILRTLLLCVLVALQIFLIITAFTYQPEPQDVIEEYTLYVSPRADGSLDVTYCFTWTPLDPEEDLTWVEIGMPNKNFTAWISNRSDNIVSIYNYTDGEGYYSARVYFNRPYRRGETFDFHFTVNVQSILSTTGSDRLHEFVPCWFNYTPVEHYTFYFERYGDIRAANSDRQNEDWLIWEGELPCGEYVSMRVSYNSFNAAAVRYESFDGEGCYNGLAEDKNGMIGFVVFACFLIFIFELFTVDAYVSYARGRGFITGYGHHVHVHGRVNPLYRSAATSHRDSRGGGGGCACACACACAGGGRAGCSQKDTYGKIPPKNTEAQ